MPVSLSFERATMPWPTVPGNWHDDRETSEEDRMNDRQAAKKAGERKLFDKAYKDSEYEWVKEHEMPDFLVKQQSHSRPFGVELTELFIADWQARLTKIPNYIPDLFATRTIRHKDDQHLVPQAIQVKRGLDGSITEGFAIIHEFSTWQEYLSRLAHAIREKGDRFANYSKDVRHINLLIHDQTDWPFDIPRMEICESIIRNATIKEAVTASPFREILVVKNLSRNKGVEVVVPLKETLLFRQVRMFGQGYLEFQKQEPSLEVLPWTLLASWLRDQGISIICKAQDDSEIELIYGNCGYSIRIDENHVFNDYNDREIPGPFLEDSDSQPLPRVDAESRFIEFLNQYSNKNGIRMQPRDIYFAANA
jgi:hypothetical protein